MATKTTQWSANETQKTFMGALSKDNYLSLKQVNAKLGLLNTEKEIKTGAINTLKTKGLVITEPDIVEYSSVVVETRVYADGTEVVITKEKKDYETGYKLA